MPAERRERCALIGHGRLGRLIASRLAEDGDGPALVAILGTCVPDAGWPDGAAPCADLQGLLAEDPDVVVECASAAALAQFGPAILLAGIDLIPLSLTAFADDNAAHGLRRAAETGPGRLVIPSGAAGVLGLVAAAREAGLTRVSFRQSYPPRAWRGTAAETLVDLGAIDCATTIFSGSVREAARLFPRHLNAATGVALAGLGLDRTRVELVADPDVKTVAYALDALAPPGRIAVTLSPIPEAAAATPDYTAFTVLAALKRRRRRIAFH